MTRPALTVLPPTTFVVVTEFACPSLRVCFLLWLRFRLYTRQIVAGAPGLTATWTAAAWRERRVLNVSCWRSSRSVYSLGDCRRHVETVRWAMRRGDINTRSDAFSAAGEWRRLMLRERAPSIVDKQ